MKKNLINIEIPVQDAGIHVSLEISKAMIQWLNEHRYNLEWLDKERCVGVTMYEEDALAFKLKFEL